MKYKEAIDLILLSAIRELYECLKCIGGIYVHFWDNKDEATLLLGFSDEFEDASFFLF